jgi:anti-anti-sigma factor
MPNYTLKVDGTAALITMKKDLTIYFNQDMPKVVKELGEQGVTTFTFNLGKTDWIDSMGIGCIFAAGKICQKVGQRAIVINANEKVRYSIALMRLDKWIQVT